ncbi:uncharacterized protein [Ptychodera flava]|uniref:uncharacterized protein n=1 Tax=Ptychodera flava TaxID=63121 RepID=UPI00396A03A9
MLKFTGSNDLTIRAVNDTNSCYNWYKMFALQLTALLICSVGMSGATFICIGDYTNDLCSLTSDQSPCPHPGSPLYQDCVSGVCRCTGQGYSPCTCLPSVGECEVTADAAGAMATYAYGNGTIRGNHLYSCNGRHENLELHVIANYESNGLSNGDYHTTGNTRVLIHGRCNRVPIVLVFASYKPVNWILDFADPEVIISKVLLISSFVDRSYISHQHGRVTNIERSDQLPWGYGDDSEAGDTVGLLKYLMGRFGHVTSFSGTLKADKWELKLISEDIALDVTTTGPELEDCWSGEQCNSCKQDYVGAINNIPVCCQGCRVPRFVFVLNRVSMSGRTGS